MSDSTNDVGDKKGWFGRLAGGLKRTSSALGNSIDSLLNKRPLDPAMLDEIEEALIRTDLGMEASARVTDAIAKGRFNENPTADEVRTIIAEEVAKVLEPVAKPLVVDDAQKPFVILVVGVNGSGKTTTIGKLAAKLSAEGRKVMLAAGDTFRAAAIRAATSVPRSARSNTSSISSSIARSSLRLVTRSATAVPSELEVRLSPLDSRRHQLNLVFSGVVSLMLGVC